MIIKGLLDFSKPFIFTRCGENVADILIFKPVNGLAELRLDGMEVFLSSGDVGMTHQRLDAFQISTLQYGDCDESVAKHVGRDLLGDSCFLCCIID